MSFISTRNIILQLYRNELFSLVSVLYFISIWVLFGNYISLAYNLDNAIFLDKYNYIYLLLYFTSILLIFISIYKELSTIFSKYIKLLIITQLTLFGLFIFAPPRNADAMRVWLSKPYDHILNYSKILRPYAHYNTPDAFTLFHLPLVQIGDGQLFQLSIYTTFVAVLIILFKLTKKYSNINISQLSILLFIFNPLITLGATVIVSDMPLILSVAGIMYSVVLFHDNPKWALIVMCIFTSFGLNIKYNAIIFLPAIFIWFSINHKTIINNLDIKVILISLIFIINGIYPYAINYINIGNPVWPAFTSLFSNTNQEWIKPAQYLNGFLNDEISIRNLIISFYNLLTMPHHINPIVILLILFIFQRFNYVNYFPAIIVSSYIFILWLMMPKFAEHEKERYILYLFPVIIPYGLIGLRNILKMCKIQIPKTIIYIKFLIIFFIYMSFNIFYSKDAIAYVVLQDKEQWHKHTWYYKEYKWINNNVKLNNDEKILVNVSGQTTFYLKKKYINSDHASGYLSKLDIYKNHIIYMSELKKHNIMYIFIDITASLNKQIYMLNYLKDLGYLTIHKEFDTYISSSRLFNKGINHKTILYKVEQNIYYNQ